MFGNHTIGGAQSTQRSASLQCNKYDTEMFGFSQIPAIAAGGAYTTHPREQFASGLTVKSWNYSFPQGKHQTQGRTKEEEVGDLKVKLPNISSIQHHGAAGSPGRGVVSQDTRM